MLHIEYLSLRHDCVIVPGVGAFIKLHNPARYDDVVRKWIPMSQTISFNPEITHNDALLASSYARKYKVSFNEAQNLLESDIRTMRQYISSYGECTVGNLGILRQDSEGKYSFIPRVSANQFSAELGLFPVDGNVIGQNEESIRLNRNSNQDSLQKADAIGNATEESSSENDTVDVKFDFEHYYYIPVNKRAVKVAASLLLLAVVALSIFLPSSKREIEDRASVIPVESIIDSAAEKLSLQDKVDNTINIDQDTSTDSHLTEETEDIKSFALDETEGNDYYLIVGTFHSLDEAKRFSNTASDKGYDLEVISSKTLHRVSAKGSSDKSELLKELNSDSFRENFPQAWIWKNDVR